MRLLGTLVLLVAGYFLVVYLIGPNEIATFTYCVGGLIAIGIVIGQQISKGKKKPQ